jgi:hypothetical protein
VLFKLPPVIAGLSFAPDLQRALVSVPVDQSGASTLNLVLNWPSGLKGR